MSNFPPKVLFVLILIWKKWPQKYDAKRLLNQGPHLHIVITTLRCNQSCKYCHASRTDMDRVDTDMGLETAKLVVDTAMQSPSPYVCFEYTGGEPTINMEAIRFMVAYAKERNRNEKKTVEHSIVTNMTYMNEENAQFLIDNDIWVCTSLDGPSEVHNWNRTWQKGSGAYENVLKWIAYFNQKYIEKGLDPDLYHVDALMTTTRKTFDHWKELVDLYVELIKNIHIRPLNPFGFANKTWRVIGYTIEEYLDFYSRVLDYILELNLQGVQIMEGTAALFLKKILTQKIQTLLIFVLPSVLERDSWHSIMTEKCILRMKVAWSQLWEMIIFYSVRLVKNSIKNSHIIQRYKHLLIQVFWMVCHNVIVVGTLPIVVFDRFIII